MVSKADLITDYDPFKHLWAYDPIIKRQTVHIIKGKIAVSLVTGHRFKLNENQIKKFKEEGRNKMKTKTKVMESTRHKSLSCKVCGSHDIKMQPVSQDLYLLWCESCSQDNRVEKTVAFATKEDLNDAL